MSNSGTVIRTQNEDPETPRSSRSRLGMQEKASNTSLEDSAINLAEVMHINNFVGNFLFVVINQCIVIMYMVVNAGKGCFAGWVKKGKCSRKTYYQPA